MTRNTLTALDLFAGTGWGVACQRLGITEYGVEIMPEAIASRDAAGMHTPFRDVWDVLAHAPLDSPEFRAALEIASPPCQTFSVAGKGTGRRALDDVLALLADQSWKLPGAGLRDAARDRGLDDRTALVLTPLAYAYRFEPTYVVLEQVPTVLPVWQAVAAELRTLGYSAWTGVLNAEQYGVPQTRKRAILIARRDGVKAAPPVPTHSRYYPRDPKRLDEGVLPWVIMADALGWGLAEHPSPTVTGGGTETGGAEPIAKLARYTSRPDWAFRRPSTTIVGSFAPDIVAGPGYRKAGGPSRQNAPGSVRITAEEAAVLQSYPADFPFQGAKGKRFLQIGNAVPPLLAEAILGTLLPCEETLTPEMLELAA